jgi:hypothetical protein
MAERVDPRPITRLLPELTTLLRASGFTPLADKSEWTGKFNVFTWVRRSWKHDTVRLGWRKPTRSYFLNASWSTPRPGATDVAAAGINPAFERRGVPGRDLPTRFLLLADRAERRWVADVLADAQFAIAWLDACETVSGALAELERPERNGPAQGSEAFAYAESYVRAHASRGGNEAS